MPKKGVSADEKKTRMVELLRERKEVFQLRELETVASKQKGIISNAVKDVLISLVSDDAIDSDKVGISTYFWSFPSQTTNKLKRQIDDLTSELEESKAHVKRIRSTVEHESHGKQESADNNKILATLETLRKRKQQLAVELKAYEQCDPTKIRQRQKFTEVAKDAANRWTDNVLQIHRWIREKSNMTSAQVKKEFGIDEEIAYVD